MALSGLVIGALALLGIGGAVAAAVYASRKQVTQQLQTSAQKALTDGVRGAINDNVSHAATALSGAASLATGGATNAIGGVLSGLGGLATNIGKLLGGSGASDGSAAKGAAGGAAKGLGSGASASKDSSPASAQDKDAAVITGSQDRDFTDIIGANASSADKDIAVIGDAGSADTFAGTDPFSADFSGDI